MNEIARPRPAEAADAALARRAADALGASMREGAPPRLRLEDAGEGEALDLPPAVVALLREALEALAAGRAPAVVARAAEMSTMEAAEALAVSRPFLVRLLEEGRIPHRKVGRHRRVRAEDVLAYKAAIDAEREAVLDRLAAEAQAEGMGYDPA